MSDQVAQAAEQEDWDEMVCVGCGASVIDDGTDATLGWVGGDEGWFCPDEPTTEQAPSTDQRQWSVEAADGVTAFTSQEIAEHVADGESGWTLHYSPIVAAHTRTSPDAEWQRMSTRPGTRTLDQSGAES